MEKACITFQHCSSGVQPHRVNHHRGQRGADIPIRMVLSLEEIATQLIAHNRLKWTLMQTPLFDLILDLLIFFILVLSILLGSPEIILECLDLTQKSHHITQIFR